MSEVTHVQGWVADAERPAGPTRPVHAVPATFTDDAFDLGPATVCGRHSTVSLVAYLPLAPWQNTPAEDRCATCETLIRQTAAGLPAGIPRYDATYR